MYDHFLEITRSRGWQGLEKWQSNLNDKVTETKRSLKWRGHPFDKVESVLSHSLQAWSQVDGNQLLQGHRTKKEIWMKSHEVHGHTSTDELVPTLSCLKDVILGNIVSK